jgi:hypothetical protein
MKLRPMVPGNLTSSQHTRMLRMTVRITLAFLVAFMTVQPALVAAQSSVSLARTARIDESSLKGLINDPSIWSFDIAPDGRAIALLAAAGSKVDAPLWLVTEDIRTNRAIASRELGASVWPMADFAPQVLYAADRRNLIVQDLKTIRIFDSETLKLVRTIRAPSIGPATPLFVISASNADVLVCAFGSEEKFNPRCHTTRVQVLMVDIRSGERLAEWACEDVPQSISSDGGLIAVSSSEPQRGVLPLRVVDTNGHKVAETTGGFSFKHADPSKTTGRVMGLFVGPRELLLTPDQNFDKSGSSSGDGLQLVKLTGDQIEVEETIRPPHYRATGEMATSADHKTIVALSWYVPDRLLVHEGVMPNVLPEMLVLRRSASLHVDAARPIDGYGLRMSGRMENRRPRISSDGSVIAIAQDTGVTVLMLKTLF